MRKKLRVEDQKLKAQLVSSSMAGIRGDQRRTPWDFVTSGIQGISSSIAQGTIEANNELKLGLISMVQQS